MAKKDRLKEFTLKRINKIEDIWVKHSIIVCLIIGFLSGALHFFGLITNIRNLMGNVVSFASIVIGVTGVFLTLLITLDDSDVMKRIREFFPAFRLNLYHSLRSQINLGLAVVVGSIIITSLPQAPYRFLASIGVSIWSYFFWYMSLGAFYAVKLVTDIIVKNFDFPQRKSRQ
ncbi:hypothetical protein [Paenibacillus sp. B01]|uniref:hypothetical protein n=1 Tax=Paenibacillus sp. B01 TaxID=2660554 RepID=UPI00129A3134|nr:hypothetical protein [Paenibacillus sp. B01]QGG57423.1 hypothetical protein GE073_18685 [Paenibacillus sp. B01]